MTTDIVMPKMGESITEGTILEWRKEVGDSIELDEILLEIGTDKVDSEIPSAVSGTIVEILAEPNDVIEVGKVIARIDSSGKVLKKEEILNEKEDLEEKQQVQNFHAEYIENKTLPKSIEVAGIKKNKEEWDEVVAMDKAIRSQERFKENNLGSGSLKDEIYLHF